VMLFKMLFIGYFFGIRSWRRMEQKIKVNKETKVSTTDPDSGYRAMPVLSNRSRYQKDRADPQPERRPVDAARGCTAQSARV